MNLSIKFIFTLIIITLILVSCKRKTPYEQLVEKELRLGNRKDTTLMGVYFGMTRKDFYAHCWKMNKQGLVKQGSKNLTVEYELTNLKSPAKLNFFPSFKDDTIFDVSATAEYIAWAPWNKDLCADSLLLDLITKWEFEYGNDFLHVTHPEKGELYVDVDGNRRIILSTIDEKTVKILYSNLYAE